MKRFFTLAIIAMIASLSFAQAPANVKKAAPKAKLEKVMKTSDMHKAMEMKAAKQAKAKAADVQSTSVFRYAAKPSSAFKGAQKQMEIPAKVIGGAQVTRPAPLGKYTMVQQLKSKKAFSSAQKVSAPVKKVKNAHYNAEASRMAVPKLAGNPTEIVATIGSAEYYADDGDWFCVLQNAQNAFAFDIVTNNPAGLELNHEYTLADMDPSYSYCQVNGSTNKKQYASASFKAYEGAYGNDYEANVTLTNGDAYHITYTSAAPEVLEVVASTAAATWYGAPDYDWFVVVANANFEFRFDIVDQSPDGLVLNHEYTLADMLASYSWGKNKATGASIKYKTVSLKPLDGANGVDYAITIVDTNDNTYNVTYTTVAPPEATETVEIEFTPAETDLVDATASQGVAQFTGVKEDTGLEAFVAFITNEIPGEYTFQNIYPLYTGFYLDADDMEGVECVDLKATVTDLGNGAYKAYMEYLGANTVLYKLTFNYGEAADPDPDPDPDPQPEGVKVTTDANGIITNVEGGEARVYTRSTDAFYSYVSSQQVKYAYQGGVVNAIADGNDLYIKDIICNIGRNTWVKGSLSEDGKKLIIPAGQMIYWNADGYGMTVNMGETPGTWEKSDADITYTVDGNTLTLDGAHAYVEDGYINFDDAVLGAFWSDDDTWTGYGEWSTVLTYDPEYVAPSTDLVELPAGAEVEQWHMNAVSVSSKGNSPITNQAVNVAFVGGDVYVQGIFKEEFPNAWIKGTIDGTNVTFENVQYIGKDSYGDDTWAQGYDATAKNLCDFTATFDAAKKTITGNVNLLANCDVTRPYYDYNFSDIYIFGGEVEEPTITNLTAELPYANSFNTVAEQDEAAIYDANADGKTFTFTAPSGGDNETTAARYNYSSANAGDDYVVFPGLTLTAGTSYKVSVDARSYGSYFPERFEVVCGTEAKASKLTTSVIPATEIASATYATYTADFTPEADGVYYFAIHGISDANMFWLYTDNFSVKENNMSAPSVPTDLTVTPDPEAKLAATVEFNAPAVTLAGDAITGEVSCVVKRNDDVIKEVAVAAGELVQFVDDAVPAPGHYTYSVVAAVNGASSDVVSAKVYVGEDVPDDVENLEAKDLNGKVALSWDAVTEGMNYGIIIPENVRYNVYPVEMVDFFGYQFPAIDYDNPYALEISETQYDVDFDTNTGAQGYTYFGVSASNAAGESGGAMTGTLTGAPYELPVHEDLSDGLSYWWGVDMDENNYSLSQLDDVGLFLGEDNSFEFVTGVQGWVTLQSGKIALNGSENAAVVFDAKGDATFVVSAYGPASETPVTMEVAGGADYANVSFPLSELSDQPWIRFEIKADFYNAGVANVKNLNVLDLVANDLDIAISAPKSLTAGKSAVVKATVTNKGQQVAEDYTVKFYINDEELPTPMFETPALAFFESAEFETEIAASIFDEVGDVTVKAVVEYAMDEKPENNEDETIVTIVAPSATPVESVAAEAGENTIIVNWTPSEFAAAEVTEDFESYEANTVFADGEYCGSWKAVDVNKGLTYSWESGAWDHMGEAYSFGIIDIVDEGLDGSFEAVSGTKMAIFMSEVDAVTQAGSVSDKYMISPELPGVAQTVSFSAQIITSQYGPETFEVMVSTSDDDVASFTSVKKFSVSEEGMAEYSVNLPEGAKYFAIHYTSNDVFGLFLDDVKYTTGGSAPIAYNIYLDQTIEATVDGEQTSYTIENVEGGSHVVSVSAVYAHGESAPVSAIVDVATGIQNINANDAKAEIYTVNGVRVQKANKPGVYVINGRKAVIK